MRPRNVPIRSAPKVLSRAGSVGTNPPRVGAPAEEDEVDMINKQGTGPWVHEMKEEVALTQKA